MWGGARVKLPTADESRGLGTGEIDYGPGAGIVQPVGPRWSLIATMDYVIRGDPEGFDLENTIWYSGGAQLRLTPDSTFGLFYDRRESVVRGRDALEDLGLTWAGRFTPSLSIPVTAFYGLSDTAEDWGLSVGIAIRGGS